MRSALLFWPTSVFTGAGSSSQFDQKCSQPLKTPFTALTMCPTSSWWSDITWPWSVVHSGNRLWSDHFVQYNLLMLTSGLQFHNKIHLCTEYFHRYFLKTVAVRDISWHAVWTTERRPSRKCLQPFSSTKGKLNPNKKYIYLKSLKLTLSPHCINKDRITIRKIKWKILHRLNNNNFKKLNY